MRQVERERAERVEDDERAEDRLAFVPHRHVQIGDAIGRVEPEDVEHRPDRREDRRDQEKAPEIDHVPASDMREDDEERERGKERVEDRREDARQVAPDAPALDGNDVRVRVGIHLHPSLAPDSPSCHPVILSLSKGAGYTPGAGEGTGPW